MFGNTVFRGMHPKFFDSPRLLPQNAARQCFDVYLKSGSLKAIREIKTVGSFGNFPATTRSIYKYDNGGPSDSARWFAWNSENVFAVRSPIADDSDRRVIWTGDGAPKQTATSILRNFSSPGTPTSRTLGVPAPSAAPQVAEKSITADGEMAETHAWVFTFLTDFDEEGPPSIPSGSITRRFDAQGNIQPVTITTPTSVSGTSGVNRKRIYRTATGASGGTEYFLVGQTSLSASTFTDNIQTSALGLELISVDWDPPPAGLQGLLALPNGVLAGFEGRDLYFSYPYQPHAWPRDYVQTLDYDIVGIGNFGLNVVVGTKRRPYLVSGAHPASVSVSRMELEQPCVSMRSFASIDQMGISYVSPEGIVLVGPGGAEVITKSLYDPASWYQESFSAAFYNDGSWYGYGGSEGFTGIDPENEGVVRYTPPQAVRCHATDPDTDRVYLYSSAERQLLEFPTGENDLRFGIAASSRAQWTSAPSIGPVRAYSAAQVIAHEDAYPLQLDIYAGRDANAAPVYSLTVENAKPMRLGSGTMASEWWYRISGFSNSRAAVEQVIIGSMKDMLGV